ncbi:MAG: 3-hydroxyacyl-CoA dehydrogenase NAD-binding domain-containing protein [Alphaproteobacteria bacterium]|nr:3-hydroxyacyl-CoA dehydrogenase NAD-binding domain-containing protein [Alphaproteobacteria bacterium]
MAVEKIGVVGAGQMGTGIAHVLALAGYDVVLDDINKDALSKAIERVQKNMQRQAAKGLIKEEEIAPALARIRVTATLDDLKDRDLVIEAATEDEAIKKKIFQDLCTRISPNAMIATNTSSISVTRLAASTDRPEHFIGLHFMNPVPVMQLVEVIRGIATNDSTFQSALEIVPMINEAVYTLYEGVGNVDAIDTAMRLGANHPMGPLQLADFIGLDTCLSVMQVLYEGLADSKYRHCPLLVKYVEAGWLGRKTGRGFYDYRGEHPVPTR